MGKNKQLLKELRALEVVQTHSTSGVFNPSKYRAFAKIVKGFQQLTVFPKCSTLDVCQGSE